jgi:hypothetical protein
MNLLNNDFYSYAKYSVIVAAPVVAIVILFPAIRSLVNSILSSVGESLPSKKKEVRLDFPSVLSRRRVADILHPFSETSSTSKTSNHSLLNKIVRPVSHVPLTSYRLRIFR